jgi:hypothetical protein
MIDSLNVCGVVAVVNSPADWPQTAEDFDDVHHTWCTALLNSLHSAGIDKASYGRAAKVIAVYLKSRIVLAGHHDTAFGKVIHPPFDGILLREIANRTFVLIQQPFDTKDNEKEKLNICRKVTAERVGRVIQGYDYTRRGPPSKIATVPAWSSGSCQATKSTRIR